MYIIYVLINYLCCFLQTSSVDIPSRQQLQHQQHDGETVRAEMSHLPQYKVTVCELVYTPEAQVE